MQQSHQWNPLSDNQEFNIPLFIEGQAIEPIPYTPIPDTDQKQLDFYSSLSQQFSDFSFLSCSYSKGQIRISQVINDLNRNLDNFLNDNIKSILSLARIASSNEQYESVLSLLKMILKRRLFASKEIIVLVKHCFFIRELIQISERFSDSYKLKFYKLILSVDQNHYNSPFTNSQIKSQIDSVYRQMLSRTVDMVDEGETLFDKKQESNRDTSPLVLLYINDLKKTSFVDTIKNNIPFSLGIIISVSQIVHDSNYLQSIPPQYILKKIEDNIQFIYNLPKNDIEVLMRHSSLYFFQTSSEIKSRFYDLQMQMASEMFQSSSIEKKIWALSVINEKIKLIKAGYKDYTLGIEDFLTWIEKNKIYQNVVQFNVHSEIINRSNQLVKFLYDHDRIGINEIKEVIQLALKSESDSITAFVHTFLIHLEYKDLEVAFAFIVSKAEDQQHINGTIISLLQSIISSHKLSNSGKKSNKKKMFKQQKQKSEQTNNADLFEDKNKQKKEEIQTQVQFQKHKEEEIHQEGYSTPKRIKIIEIEEPIVSEPSQLSLKIFRYVISHIDQYPLIPVIIKLITNEPAIFNQIPQFLIASIRQDRPSSIHLLDSIIKLSFPIPKDKGLWTRSELISWMANEGLFQYLIKGIALHRFEKEITERINLLILVARYYNKPFELFHVQYLWKILGLRSTQQKEREQFFMFVKDCLTKCNNMLFTEESIHYIYFQILLRLHAEWYTLKVYECLEMFFIRLNQDCKLIGHSNGPIGANGSYQLIDTQLIGVKKLWYIYLRGQDPRVTKKCRQFLCRMISKFDYSEKIGQTAKEQYIHILTTSLKSSYDIITTTNGDNKQQHVQIGRCLDMLIKLIEDLDGINITGDKIGTGEEWVMNIINNCQNSLPPKKFTIKVNVNSTLRMLREQIGTKLNPPKKQNQIKLMTRGQYPKGENMTLKELKFINKQTFMIESSQQLLSENQTLFNENTFQMLKSMFSNHSENLIKFVMMKRLGEDEQAIAEVLLDEETVSNYLKQIEGAKVVPKQLSQFLVSNVDIFELFFEILSLHSEQHSYMIWRIISHLPNNSHNINLIKDTILETHQWNEIFSFDSNNFFKTLYHLQLLKNILTGGVSNVQITKNEQTDLTNQFVEAGGLDHLYKNLRGIMNGWKGDFLEAKLLSHLIEVFKIYLKPHLTQIVKQPLNFMFKEVTNYKKHLKELGNHDIRHIITEIVSPQQTNTITSKSWKSFSFKGQSVSSNATPGFKSPNDSGRNSPHSQTPRHEKQQDNISMVSMSKSINTSKNSKKRRPMIQHSFEARMRQNMNLQQNLKLMLNINQLVQLIFRSLRMIIQDPSLLVNEDVIHFSEELFEILFPVLLINNSYSLIFNNNEIIQIITKGMAEVINEQIRIKLVYLIFLLCVIEEQDKLIVEDDDELFMTEAKKLKPRIFFLKTLLPIFETEANQYETYFLCLSKLIKQIDSADLKQFFDASKFAEQILKRIKQRPFIQTLQNDTQDYTLNGLLMVLQVLLQKFKQIKSDCNKLIFELSQYLFELPNEFSEETPAVNYPKYKRRKTRRRCFEILIQLCKDSEENKLNLCSILTEYCKDLHSKEYYDSVLIRSEKYSGLKNLGATCYINSILQQFHKNTDLKYLITNPAVININQQHPLHELSYLFSSLTISLMSNVNPHNFIKTVRFHGNQQINTKIQQDVNEFFMAFVDLMERNQAKQILQSCLMGEICNQITCCEENQALKFVKKHTEQFYTITLDIKGKKNLQEALQFFVKGDLLDGDNKYYSEQLNSKVKAVKRSYLKTLPNCLVFTLKRFEFDYNTMLRYKLNDYFQFPLEIDLTKYTQQTLSQQIQQMHEESYFKYRLVGVLVHSGTAESGHYYSYIKENEKWYQFNDSQVTEFNISNLKNECFGGDDKGNDFDNRSRNAYLLFYERIEPLETPFSEKIKQHKITGQYSEFVWKENFKFLKSRLVYDMDFIKFVQEIKSEESRMLLEKVQGKPLQKCFVEFENINDLDVANPDIVMAIQGNDEENVMREIPIDNYDESTPLIDADDAEDGNFLSNF